MTFLFPETGPAPAPATNGTGTGVGGASGGSAATPGESNNLLPAVIQAQTANLDLMMRHVHICFELLFQREILYGIYASHIIDSSL